MALVWSANHEVIYIVDTIGLNPTFAPMLQVIPSHFFSLPSHLYTVQSIMALKKDQ